MLYGFRLFFSLFSCNHKAFMVKQKFILSISIVKMLWIVGSVMK